jgi:hypothetical protein
MRLRLIACDVFLREICACVAKSPHVIDLAFTRLGSHENSRSLRTIIQEKIDESESADRPYDAILLGYGLCGNAAAGLRARSRPLIMPRAHDCCTIFLGSKAAFQRLFGDNPSQPFSTLGYMERCATHLREENCVSVDGKLYHFDDYVQMYGEENARYIFEQLGAREGSAKSTVFIDMPETRRLGGAEACRMSAEAAGRGFSVVRGNTRLIKGLVNGPWNDKDFCTVAPGQEIQGVYDWDEIVRVVSPAK